MRVYGVTQADLGATPRQACWQGIRSLRATPPGHAVGDRHKTFSTALEQAEQLLTAAATTGPAARPLPLFYGLSQAGRAIAAARLDDGPWKIGGHGLTQVRDGARTLADSTIKPAPMKEGDGAFQVVARALGSSGLPGPTKLGALWPLIADTRRFPLPEEGPHRLVDVDINPVRSLGCPINGELSGLPAHLGVKRIDTEDGLFTVEPRDDWCEEKERVRDYLTAYPSLSGYRFQVGGGQPIGLRLYDDGTQAYVPVHWLDDPDQPPLTVTQLRRQVAVDFRGHSHAYPRLEEKASDPIHPLVVWWAVLFGLSILARYEPETWGRVVDVDHSAEAVAIETLLDVALDAIPELVLRCLNDDL